MKVLKDFMRQNVRPTGSTVEDYLIIEAMHFVFEYVMRVDPVAIVLNSIKGDERITSVVFGRTLKPRKMNSIFYEQAFRFVPANELCL